MSEGINLIFKNIFFYIYVINVEENFKKEEQSQSKEEKHSEGGEENENIDEKY